MFPFGVKSLGFAAAVLAGCAAFTQPARAAETPPWGDEPMAFPAQALPFGG